MQKVSSLPRSPGGRGFSSSAQAIINTLADYWRRTPPEGSSPDRRAGRMADTRLATACGALVARCRFRTWIGLLVMATAGTLLGVPAQGAEPARAKVDFARQVRPILAENCFECHGPDPQGPQGRPAARHSRRRVRRPRRLRRGRSRPARGERADRPDQRRSDPEERHAAARLAARADEGPGRAARAMGRRGGRLERALVVLPPRTAGDPRGARSGWCRNPIDRFILARLEPGRTRAVARGRSRHAHPPSQPRPARPAARRPRRSTSSCRTPRPDAYERLVDRLLASPHFGERWARPWLDLVRYADSDGYEDDRYRPDAWRYRDWVIAAFNRDMPFDRFTIEQLAGDLLARRHATNSGSPPASTAWRCSTARRSAGTTRRSSASRRPRTARARRPPSGWG